MTQTTYFKDFMKYASLNVLGMMGISFYILADTFFISKGIGANGLAALNLAIPIYSFIHGCGLMLGMGGATKYSIYKSQKKQENANIVFTNTLFLTAGFALLFFIMGLFFSRPITTALGANKEIFAMTNTYLKVILLFSPAFITNEVLLSFVRNDGAPGLSMTGMISGSLMNIVFDYIFIFPMNMGIFGAVLATGFSPICSLLILSTYKLKKQNQFHIIKTNLRPDTSRSILSLGFPSLVTEVSAGIVMIIFNIIILNLEGNIGVAAYGVIANLALVVIAIFTGIGQGMQPIVSHTYGLNDKKNSIHLLHYALVSVVILSAVLYGFIFFGAAPITAVFNSEHNVKLQIIAEEGLKLYFSGIVFAGSNIIFSIYFTSIEKAAPAHLISILRGLLLIIPFAYLLSALFGISGVWLAFPAAELIVTIIGIILYRHTKKTA